MVLTSHSSPTFLKIFNASIKHPICSEQIIKQSYIFPDLYTIIFIKCEVVYGVNQKFFSSYSSDFVPICSLWSWSWWRYNLAMIDSLFESLTLFDRVVFFYQPADVFAHGSSSTELFNGITTYIIHIWDIIFDVNCFQTLYYLNIYSLFVLIILLFIIRNFNPLWSKVFVKT